MADVIAALNVKPVVVGHSFGGLMAQIIAGRGLSAASVAIDPAPFRGVLPLPLAAMRSTLPVLRQSAQPRPGDRPHLRPVPLRLGQRHRRRGGEAAARDLPRRRTRCSRSSRRRWPISTRRPRSRSTAKQPRARPAADLHRREGPRGATGDEQRRLTRSRARNQGVTELAEVPNRGHSLTIDSGWREIADRSLEFRQALRLSEPPNRRASRRFCLTISV